MIVVSDTTPLISLLKIERLDLLKKLFENVLIPQAVYEEHELTSDEVKECVSGLQRAGRHIGQRHYQMLLDKIAARGMTEEGMEQYLDTFKYGMPPHGGLGIGLERLTMKLVGEDNVRETTLFPRDLSRLEP